MKKLAVLAVAVLALAVAAVAYAQEVTNTYSVNHSVSPSKAGTKKKPVPIGVKFSYTVGEVQNRRPAPIQKYSIKSDGLIINTQYFPKCSTSTLESQGPDACPKGSLMGSGFIRNATGATSDPNDRSIECNASVQYFNAGNGKGNLYVQGSPQSTDPRTRCAIELAAPIPMTFIRSKTGTTQEFEVPSSLLHPLPTLSNAVTSVSVSIKKVTRKVKGKKRGFFESVGGCSKRKTNALTVTFTPESGPSKRAQHLAKCRR